MGAKSIGPLVRPEHIGAMVQPGQEVVGDPIKLPHTSASVPTCRFLIYRYVKTQRPLISICVNHKQYFCDGLQSNGSLECQLDTKICICPSHTDLKLVLQNCAKNI